MYSKEFRILDLFCGAGGFSYGLHTVEGFSTEVALEWDPVIINTFKKNMPDTDCVCGDICDEKIKEIVINKAKERKVNMIIGGPPCQGFSLKGKNLGLDDPRNFLFLEYVDIVEKIKPQVFVIENVKNMISSGKGFFINQIYEKFEKIGYTLNHGILNASYFGVPQTRERTIIIGTLDKRGISLPEGNKNKIITVREAISDLSYLNSVEENENLKYVFNPGPFTKILKRAIKDPNDMYFLIIEELNRGNAPAIFGEIFQLLDRNDKGVSEYRITNFDIAKEIYNDKNEKIYIPANLTILATMNTADQNVFTLDTAFQRRWIMKQIKNDFHDIKNKKQVSTVIDDGITWGDFATVINDKYIEYNRDSFSASDKRMGVYFAKASELTSRERFAEKVLKYLWDDAFKMDHTEIFSDEIETFDDLVVEYESVGEHNLKRILRSDVYEKIAKRRAVEQSKNED